MTEGKAAIFKWFGDIEAWPLCLDTQDVDEIIAVVNAVALAALFNALRVLLSPSCPLKEGAVTLDVRLSWSLA